MESPPTLHHVGIATADAMTESEQWRRILGYRIVVPLTHDPIQRVKVLFMSTGQERDVPVELVEPATEDSPVNGFLRRGGGFYHACYEVDDIEQALDRAEANGAIVVQTPVEAVVYNQRRIAWCYTPSRRLIEYLERLKEPGRHG